jgi:hypothetical protein
MDVIKAGHPQHILSAMNGHSAHQKITGLDPSVLSNCDSIQSMTMMPCMALFLPKARDLNQPDAEKNNTAQ